MVDKIKPISRVRKTSKVRKVKYKLHNPKNFKDLFFKDILSRAYDKKVKPKEVIEEEKPNNSDNDDDIHFIDTLC